MTNIELRLTLKLSHTLSGITHGIWDIMTKQISTDTVTMPLRVTRMPSSIEFHTQLTNQSHQRLLLTSRRKKRLMTMLMRLKRLRRTRLKLLLMPLLRLPNLMQQPTQPPRSMPQPIQPFKSMPPPTALPKQM